MPKNSAGYVTSNTVAFAILSMPVITSQPADVTVEMGSTASFQVSATGGGLSIQWYYRTSPTDSWKEVSDNGTYSSCTITADMAYNGYQYCYELSNSIDSATVTLTMK